MPTLSLSASCSESNHKVPRYSADVCEALRPMCSGPYVVELVAGLTLVSQVLIELR
jgi:hypothetical protein